jgi:hypothetical protein
VTVITKDHELRAATDLIILIDEKIQDELYERLSSGMIERERFGDLTQKLREWQNLCLELISAMA